MANTKLSHIFFSELRKYNNTNFRTVLQADLSEPNYIVNKAFSSIITRYFIFIEKHPELSETDIRMLYFQLKLDLLAKYFVDFPNEDCEPLREFQSEVRSYMEKKKEETTSGHEFQTSAI